MRTTWNCSYRLRAGGDAPARRHEQRDFDDEDMNCAGSKLAKETGRPAGSCLPIAMKPGALAAFDESGAMRRAPRDCRSQRRLPVVRLA